MKPLYRFLGPARRFHQWTPSLAIGTILPLSFLAVIVVPVQSMIAITRMPGVTSSTTEIYLPLAAKALLLASGLICAMGSVMVGGYAKRAYPKLASPVTLSVHIFAGAGAFLVCGSMLRDVTPIFGKSGAGDNAWLLSYLGFWLLMIGYMLKAPWDEARDRLARLLTPVDLASGRP